MKIINRRFVSAVFGFYLLLTGSVARAEVVRVEIESRQPFAGGMRFGQVGSYESISGQLFFEIDPEQPINQRIADLELAPRNKSGKVEFRADFFLMQPIDSAKGNGCLLYDVHNRGNKLALRTFNDALNTNTPTTVEHAGNGFLFRQGFTLLWTGWNGDVVEDGTDRLLAGLPIASNPNGSPVTGRNYVEISVDEKCFSQPFFGSPWGVSKAYPSVSLRNDDAMLTMRRDRSQPAQEVPREDWSFATVVDDKPVPDPTSLHVKEGFRPGWLYELVYTARDPRVSGLGLAGLRDAVAFLRYGSTGNPSLGRIDRACIFGISQSGRLIHQLFYDGLNRDSLGRPAFDGAIIHVAGAGKGLFNARFGMATVFPTQHRQNLSPADSFPFAPMPQSDPETGQTGDSLSRLRASGDLPRIFFVQTGTEYWSRGASLLHTDVEARQDLPLDANVRIYHIAGAAHLGASPTDRGICRYSRNPLKHRGPVLRALLVAMNQWLRDGTEPPPSRYPRIDDGSLVSVATFRKQFPRIDSVTTPESCYQPLRLDFGPRWTTDGIADTVPPAVGKPFMTLVPAVDRDGNEVAGIRLPEVAVPLATYTGWNLRDDAFGAGGLLADLHGGWFPFPTKPTDTDSRKSIRQRYSTRADYLSKYTDTVLELTRSRYLLDEDSIRLLEEAAARDLWID